MSETQSSAQWRALAPITRFLDRWEAKAGRPVSFDIAAFVYAATGIGLAALGLSLMIEPTDSIGLTIVSDHYSVTGFVPGVLIAGLGILVCTAFIAAYRAGSPRLVRTAGLGLLAASAYGSITTGQWTALLGSAILVVITWLPRAAWSNRSGHGGNSDE